MVVGFILIRPMNLLNKALELILRQNKNDILMIEFNILYTRLDACIQLLIDDGIECTYDNRGTTEYTIIIDGDSAMSFKLKYGSIINFKRAVFQRS